MTIDLHGKNILVTGSSRGIGKAIALALNAAGANIALHYKSNIKGASEIVSKAGSNVKIYQADLSSHEETIALFDKVVKDFGHIDVLINNAGIAIHSKIDQNDTAWLSDWSITLGINLTATALLCKKAIDHFIEQKAGIIINITSRDAFRGEYKDYLAYAASKGGIVALTRSIAKEFGKNGITAFNVAPGFTRTEMAQEFFNHFGEEALTKDIALDKLTEPEDIAPTVVFLCSGLARHATGSTIDINAGSYFH